MLAQWALCIRLLACVMWVCFRGAESLAPRTLVVVGGGPAGCFAAVQAAASAGPALQVFVIEQGKDALHKVLISGGGRCNVMHDPRKPVPVIVQGYPRGSVQLLGPMSKHFGPTDAARWFERRGVQLKTESDGRVFPTTDKSSTIVDCLLEALRASNGVLLTGARVADVALAAAEGSQAVVRESDESQANTGFAVSYASRTAPPPELRPRRVSGSSGSSSSGSGSSERRGEWKIYCDFVLLATGSSRDGYVWAERLGHTIFPPVPSLFTFNIRGTGFDGGGVLDGLAGVTLEDAELTLLLEDASAALAPASAAAAVGAAAEQPAGRGRSKRKAKTLSQRGPVLVTHTGLSGPAALKLSAFAARELHAAGYRGRLQLNCAPALGTPANVLSKLEGCRRHLARRTISAFCPFEEAGVPKRLWQALCSAADVGREERWADASNAKLRAVAENLCGLDLEMIGKGAFKEEFVTCGGVALKEIDMRTMESRRVPGLYFAGEVCDVDGITGGYNLQSAWSSGYIAGSAIAAAAADAHSRVT